MYSSYFIKHYIMQKGGNQQKTDWNIFHKIIQRKQNRKKFYKKSKTMSLNTKFLCYNTAYVKILLIHNFGGCHGRNDKSERYLPNDKKTVNAYCFDYYRCSSDCRSNLLFCFNPNLSVINTNACYGKSRIKILLITIRFKPMSKWSTRIVSLLRVPPSFLKL